MQNAYIFLKVVQEIVFYSIEEFLSNSTSTTAFATRFAAAFVVLLGLDTLIYNAISDANKMEPSPRAGSILDSDDGDDKALTITSSEFSTPVISAGLATRGSSVEPELETPDQALRADANIPLHAVRHTLPQTQAVDGAHRRGQIDVRRLIQDLEKYKNEIERNGGQPLPR